jgi:hypothetical protein
MKKLLFIFILFLSLAITNKTNAQKKDIDPSKPTNLYTEVNANAEYTSGKEQNVYGVRANISYAIDMDNLILAEIPYLKNDKTSKSGIGDLRIRYFTAIKRNISPMLIAIAPFADISIPTGKFEDGLGTSCWSISAGSIVGLIFSDAFALFPGIGVVHVTKPNTDLIPDEAKKTSTGIGFQFNASYSFNKSTYIFINPNPSIMNYNGIWKAYWAADINLNKIFVPNKFKMNVYWGPNFTNETHSFRLGATFFL